MTIEYLDPLFQTGKNLLKIPLVAATGAGGMLSEANPFGVDVLVKRLIVNVTTEATGVATADIGVDADGATGDDTLLDAVDIGTAAILTDNIETPGTNGQSCVVWGSTQYLVATASADPAGLVGSVYVEVQRL